MKNLRLEDPQQAALSRSGVEAARRGAIGNGKKPLIQCLRMFSFVQLDFHKIDAASIIVLKNDHGVELEVPVMRWHIGILAEEKSACVLGCYVALERTPSGDSTLEVLDNALRPDEIDQLEARNALVEDGKILLRELMPEFKYQCFAALKVDNGWSNAVYDVVNNLMDTVGCSVNFGPVRAWWRRNLIEKIFQALTQRGLQRQRLNLVEIAISEGKISRSMLLEVTQICIEASELCVRNATRASELVERFKKLEIVKHPDHRDIFDLRDVIIEMVTQYADGIEKTNVFFDVLIPHGIKIDSYPEIFGQVISNLISNSLIHAFEHRDSGRITIDASRRDQSIEIIFEDDGIGIAPELHRKIFEPFYTTKFGKGGSGLGLFMTRNLIRSSLNGEIQIESELGKGTKFTLTVP